MPVNYKGGLIAAMIEAAREGSEEKWNSDFGGTFHMSHTRAGMTAYKKASPGITIKVAEGSIPPIDGFGTTDVNLDEPGDTTKPITVVAIAYVPGLSRNLLSILKAVEQWDKLL